MSLYSLIVIFLLIPLTSFAQWFPTSMVGRYVVNEWSCLPHHSFYDDVRQVTISQSQSLTLDTCDIDDDCEGRLPYFHYYFKNIEKKAGWYVGENDLWGKNRFMLKETTRGSLSLKIDVYQKGFDEMIICTGQLKRR